MEEIAVEIAQKAGDFLREKFKKDHALTQKRGTVKEVTTQYDKDSDRLILAEIQKHFPDHNLLTEESGRIDKGSEYTWMVDSLDGTSNFASKNPLFATSIALRKRDKIILGIIYAPMLDELYVARSKEGVPSEALRRHSFEASVTSAKEGAFLNGEKIHVSDNPDFNSSYCLICEGGAGQTERLGKLYHAILPKVKDARKLGSAALECAWVANGRYDAYVTTEIEPWDVAAGILLLEEAGGKVTDFKGNPWNFQRSDLLITNGRLHDTLLEILRRV